MANERIGLIVGMETTFPEAFLQRVKELGGQAELAKLGGTRADFGEPRYRVLIDRLSHEVPFYRFHLKAASLNGTYVINDPFWWSADEKFFGYSLCTKIGVAVPRTVMLPSRSYIPAIDPRRSLRNLEFPIDWEGIARYVGFPAILKPADGGGWKNIYKVHDLGELLKHYNESGTLVMTLQQFIDYDEYVRCICIGKEFILPIKYDPTAKGTGRPQYIETQGRWLPKDVETKVLDGAWAINHALGYDMNSVEFAIKDGVPYAIDFTNPAPDMDIHSIRPKHFKIVVEEMARFALKVARSDKRNHDGFQFGQYMRDPVPRPAGWMEMDDNGVMNAARVAS